MKYDGKFPRLFYSLGYTDAEVRELCISIPVKPKPSMIVFYVTNNSVVDPALKDFISMHDMSARPKVTDYRDTGRQYLYVLPEDLESTLVTFNPSTIYGLYATNPEKVKGIYYYPYWVRLTVSEYETGLVPAGHAKAGLTWQNAQHEKMSVRFNADNTEVLLPCNWYTVEVLDTGMSDLGVLVGAGVTLLASKQRDTLLTTPEWVLGSE
jgi:hypothetical protein